MSTLLAIIKPLGCVHSLPQKPFLICCHPADDLYTEAWLIIEGPPPKLEFSGNTKTVVLSSPNHENFSTWLKGK